MKKFIAVTLLSTLATLASAQSLYIEERTEVMGLDGMISTHDIKAIYEKEFIQKCPSVSVVDNPDNADFTLRTARSAAPPKIKCNTEFFRKLLGTRWHVRKPGSLL